MKNIIIDDELFDKTFIKLFNNFCVSGNHWFYGRKSSLNKENLIWGSVLWEPGDYKNFFVEYILGKFLEKYQLKAEMLSCVLNGQTAGQSTTWHVDLYSGDQNIDDKFTLLYYVNEAWDDPSGDTVIRSDDSREHKIKFVPGRVAMFPSRLQHYAESPAKSNVLRVTCAYKLRMIGI